MMPALLALPPEVFPPQMVQLLVVPLQVVRLLVVVPLKKVRQLVVVPL